METSISTPSQFFVAKTDNGNFVIFRNNPRQAIVVTTTAVIRKDDAYFGAAQQYPVSIISIDDHEEAIKQFLGLEEIEMQRRHTREQERLAILYAPCRGWYVVTLEILVSKIKGNDGPITRSFRVLADNQMQAYDMASDMASSVSGRNISFVYHVLDSVHSGLIEFVGVWTDEAVLEYGEDHG